MIEPLPIWAVFTHRDDPDFVLFRFGQQAISGSSISNNFVCISHVTLVFAEVVKIFNV